MSGYLRRLVASAGSSGGAIHPMVGSLFGGDSKESAVPLVQEETSTVRTENVARFAADSLQEPVHASERSGLSLPSVDGDVGFAQRRLEEAAPVVIREKKTISRERTSPPVEHVARVEREQDVAPERFEPLLVKSVRRNESVQVNWLGAANYSDPKKDSVARVEREPDEIQIHIGRIEVTAVPAPVNPPQSKPVRKPLSLDDYLKRGRGW